MHLASVAKQTTEVKPPMFNLSRDLEWDIKSMRNFWLSAALTLGNERVKDVYTVSPLHKRHFDT